MHAPLSRRFTHLPLICALLAAAGCSDSMSPPVGPTRDADFAASEGRGVLQRYVAIGTSISMGWASDGVLATRSAARGRCSSHSSEDAT